MSEMVVFIRRPPHLFAVALTTTSASKRHRIDAKEIARQEAILAEQMAAILTLLFRKGDLLNDLLHFAFLFCSFFLSSRVNL